MNDVLKKNTTLLSAKFPDLYKRVRIRPRRIKDGLSFSSENIEEIEIYKKWIDRIYGGFDPKQVVYEIIANWNFKPYDILFLIGMGLGYLPIEALKKGVGNPRMVIIEPFEQVFTMALCEQDLSLLLSDERIDLFVGKEIKISEIVEKYREIIPIGRNQIIVHPYYEQIFKEPLLSIKQELTERIRALRDSWHTTKKYGRQMSANAVTNLSSLFAGTPMKNLRGMSKNIPAICVAAGPSLDHAFIELEKIKNRSLLIVCDSAVGTLLGKGIMPHVVVTTDMFESNLDKLKPYLEDLCDTVLIYGIESNPDNIRLYLSPKRVAVSAYNNLLLDWLDPSLNLQCRLPPMSSVSHMAIFTAIAMGSDPIVLVGMDLSYCKGKSHSYHSSFFHSINPKKIVKTTGNDGSKVSSSAQFVADKLFIENVAGQSKGIFVNTAVNGAYIDGTQIKRLAEVVDQISSTQLSKPRVVLENISWQSVANEATTFSLIEELIQKFERFRRTCSENKVGILARIEQMEEQGGREAGTGSILDAQNRFERFKSEQFAYLQMIDEIIRPEFHELYQEKEVRLVHNDIDPATDTLEALGLLNEHYGVYEKGVHFLIDRLKKFQQFTEKSIEIERCFKGVDQQWEKHMQRGTFFESSGQLWRAKSEYEHCMKLRPELVGPYLDLCHAYMKEGLWASAKKVLADTASVFNGSDEIMDLQNDFKKGVRALFEAIKSKWMEGDIHCTRKLMNQYLILFPKDSQINELKKVIRTLDEEFSGEWEQSESKRREKPDVQERIEIAVRYIQDLQLEKGIGVLEGIVEDFPQSRGDLREQVGDIRVMQKDYKSGLWNYSQALKYQPDNLEIKKKIDLTKSLLLQ